MDTKDEYIEHLEKTISSLQKQVDNFTDMILLLRKEKFGSSSEKNKGNYGSTDNCRNSEDITAINRFIWKL